MLDILVKGGPVMIFIGLCALAAAVIVIERFLYFFSIKKEYAVLIPALRDLLRNKKFDEAESLCAAASSPLAKLVQTALESVQQTCEHRGEQSIEQMVQFAASREIPRIERFVPALGTIANISTLLGLLGTVLGNIDAFGILADSGVMGNPSLLAGAIAEALITTAAGLIVSIPATIFHNYLVSRANHLITETETSIGELLLLMADKNNAEV
jgi:biopolymer transport protein ExbB